MRSLLCSQYVCTCGPAHFQSLPAAELCRDTSGVTFAAAETDVTFAADETAVTFAAAETDVTFAAAETADTFTAAQTDVTFAAAETAVLFLFVLFLKKFFCHDEIYRRHHQQLSVLVIKI